MPEESNAQTPRGKLVLIIGPSGVGKSVILKKLREQHPEFHFPRSATTRAKRSGEGSDLYDFVSEAMFDAMIREGKLLEWANVHAGPRYGTLIAEILPAIEEGRTVIREVDVQGFQSIRAHSLFADGHARLQTIFILPENREQLIRHITKRAPIAEEELRRRIQSMEQEILFADLCDAQIQNIEGKLNETISEVERVIKNF